ncbi:MAG TPA: PAS domain S-box protein [Candidatus Acidoferrales bacterium]|nr:PAS domain S-box protein [Candidatus Acidoferrales bacterium]
MFTDSLRKDTDQGAQAPATGEQFEKLAQLISRSQHNYRELIDNLDQALFTISLQGEVRVANLRLSEILGASFQELVGHSLSDFIESPTLADAERAIPAFLERGSWAGKLAVRLKKDRELRHFDCWLQAVAENGHVASVTGWARDVTAQRESEIRSAGLFESLSEGILFATPEGELLDANPALVRMLGYDSKEDLQKHNFREMYEDPSARDELIRKLEKTGTLRDQEIVLRRKDGRRIHCLTSGFAIRDASGRPVRVQGTIVDITDRKEMEQRLRNEQDFVRRFVASFPDLIAVLDREMRFTYIGGQVESILGRTPKEYIGGVFGARASEEDRLRLHQMFERVIRGDEVRAQVEFRAPHTDGTWRILLATASPLFDAHGQISGVVTSARDVTEAKQVEQQLAQKDKFAAMGQMMAGAAHELNNPLTAIIGVSDLLRERAADETSRRQVDLVLQQARRAATIVQNLLAFSRPLAPGRLKLRLAEIVQEALQVEQAALEKKNIRVKFTPPADLPEIEGDRKLLVQVFLNILANAEQSISTAGDRGAIEVSLARAGDKVSVTFVDDGPGIPPDIIGRIFDPFFTTKRPGGGSGLGLTICLAVVKEHGGTIEVDSSLGAGATVRVLLPIAAEQIQPESAPPVAAAKAVAPLPGSEALRGHTVLIVDDEESIREIVEDGLAARGMRVQSAESSEDALAYLAKSPCEIVLCDFNLPGMNGDKLFAEVRSRLEGSSVRFVFMTGDLVDANTAARYHEKGARILQKPFPISALADLLTELLRTKSSRAK